MKRTLFSERIELIYKGREAMLSAVQIYNNPLVTFKTESFIVLSVIAWTYILHAYYRSVNIDYRYFIKTGKRKKFDRNRDGSIRYWDLMKCLSEGRCPIDENTKNNLKFLIGLRNQIEHKKATGLDSYLSARYQACALNFNYYIKVIHGEKFGLDQNLALSLQFSELDQSQSKIIKDKENLIPKNIISYIANFDAGLSSAEIENDRFAYRLLFTKVIAKRGGQADRVIEFIDPDSAMAKNLSREYYIKIEREKPKFSATQVINRVQEAGFKDFRIYQHTCFWQARDGKNPNKGFGTTVVKTWCWYQNWIDHIIKELNKEKKKG
jgi:hypothetical protein